MQYRKKGSFAPNTNHIIISLVLQGTGGRIPGCAGGVLACFRKVLFEILEPFSERSTKEKVRSCTRPWQEGCISLRVPDVLLLDGHS